MDSKHTASDCKTQIAAICFLVVFALAALIAAYSRGVDRVVVDNELYRMEVSGGITSVDPGSGFNPSGPPVIAQPTTPPPSN